VILFGIGIAIAIDIAIGSSHVRHPFRPRQRLRLRCRCRMRHPGVGYLVALGTPERLSLPGSHGRMRGFSWNSTTKTAPLTVDFREHPDFEPPIAWNPVCAGQVRSHEITHFFSFHFACGLYNHVVIYIRAIFPSARNAVCPGPVPAGPLGTLFLSVSPSALCARAASPPDFDRERSPFWPRYCFSL
jgi:hypothetical protein